jgi:hypothetical protein
VRAPYPIGSGGMTDHGSLAGLTDDDHTQYVAMDDGSVLSGSTNGKPIPVAATSTPGTLIHTAGAGYDDVLLFVSNVTGAAATLTIEWGGVTNPGDRMTESYSIPANSLAVPVVVGQRIAAGLVVRAFSATASALNITGWVKRVARPGDGSVLSGSTNGRPIPVIATSTAGTLIHAARATGHDGVFLFASNVTGAAETLTVEWGGASDPGDHMAKEYSIPANSPPVPVVVGQRIAGSREIRAFSSTGGAINVTGWADLVG